ncbi:Protein thf1 [Anopheles sinensis]|uniref:Protein thf1 n=1 Tax=Anopheles sinensis TaxID=74873 RepID=A0A084VI00_ANOSI|nr:Protein thf1 [Anopheles sinensis]
MSSSLRNSNANTRGPKPIHALALDMSTEVMRELVLLVHQHTIDRGSIYKVPLFTVHRYHPVTNGFSPARHRRLLFSRMCLHTQAHI